MDLILIYGAIVLILFVVIGSSEYPDWVDLEEEDGKEQESD